jgi:NADPH:quinone reductase-like Zn-dependent oxidoreductase
MKALNRDRYGPPDVLDIKEIDQPVPKDDEVLVRVHSASINDWDLALLQQRPPFPISVAAPWVPILGSDIAGRVVATGKQVVKFRSGDEVYGDLSRFRSGGFGGFAEYVCAFERSLTLKPAGMTFVQAAALPQAGQLAVQGLAVNGPLKRGQKILINGAGGGVVIAGWLIRLVTGKTVRLVGLKQNKDLAYLSERFEAGQLAPVIDGPYKLGDAREA